MENPAQAHHKSALHRRAKPAEANAMTEAEARAALRAFGGGSDVEPWIAARPWKVESGGWSVLGELHGLRFHLEVMADGVRVIASMGGGREPKVWSVPRVPRQ
jgi:hypothetical protein